MHVWPCTVRTSAPGGSVAKLRFCSAGLDDDDDIQSGMDGIQSGIPLEQLPSRTLITAVAAATTNPARDMTPSVRKEYTLGPLVVPVKPGKGQTPKRAPPAPPAEQNRSGSGGLRNEPN